MIEVAVQPEVISQAASMLDEIVSLWGQTHGEYRDRMIRIGRMLRDWLIQDATESASKGRSKREEAVLQAAARLKVTRCRVYNLMGVSALVDLLGAGGLGECSYTFLVSSLKLIKRKSVPTEDNCNYRNEDNWNKWRAARETYLVRDLSAVGIDSQELFAKGVSEGWTGKQMWEALEDVPAKQGLVKKRTTARVSDLRDQHIATRPVISSSDRNMDRHPTLSTNEPNVGADYADYEREFLKAIDRYKRVNKRPHPTWSEVLKVVVELGWTPPKETS